MKSEADAMCQSMGGHVVAIEDIVENVKLTAIMRENGKCLNSYTS